MTTKGAASTPTKYTGIQIQTSSLAVAVPIVWGKVRVPINLIDYTDFQAFPSNSSKGGKGLGTGKGGAGYTYSATVIAGLCEGPISGIGKCWVDRTVTTLSALGYTLFLGTASQAPWSYMVSTHPARALSYAYTAYLASSNHDLGSGATLPNHNFEVITPLSGSMPGTVDVNLADCFADMATNAQFGIGPFSYDSTSWSFWKTYCRAQGLFFSPALVNAEQISSVVDRWASGTNTWIFFSGSGFKFVPLGDVVITANGVTYTPNLTAVYDLTPDDFLVTEGTPPISTERTDPADSPNHVKLQVKDRLNDYNTAAVEWLDSGLANTYGRVDASQSQFDEICDLGVAATVAELIGKRAAYVRNTYSFNLGLEFSLLEPGDLLTIYSPASKIFSPTLVRVTQLDENASGVWQVTTEQVTAGVGTSYAVPALSASGNTVDVLIDPGNVNPPAVFEPRSDLTGGVPQIFISASGGANWGGASVLLSFDNVEFSPVGLITAPAWQGTLTSTLASHADPDTVDTLAVDLTISDGEMSTAATHADADAFRTLCWVTSSFSTTCPSIGELLAYGAVAQGASPPRFNLTYLRRGLYGTAIASHSSGSFFSRIDLNATTGVGNTVLIYNLPAQYIGRTVYLKFVSFNRFGNAVQDVSSVVTYNYTPTGTGFGSGTAGAPATPTGLTATSGNGQNVLTWAANLTTDNVTSYSLYAAPGLGSSFGSSVLIHAGQSLTYTHSGIGNGAPFTYFLTATNAAGTSGVTSGVSATSAAAGIGTVTSVGLAAPGIFTVSGSPVTTTGTLTLTLATQTKNLVWAGPASGAAAAPTFRSLVGGDLPIPGAATLGGVFSQAVVSHFFLTGISAVDGSVSTAQPTTNDILGSSTNALATTGYLGEYVHQELASGSAVALTTSATSNLITMPLAAGDYEVTGVINLTGGATTVISRVIASVNQTSVSNVGALGTTNRYDAGFSSGYAPLGNGDVSIFIGPTRIALSASGNAFLNIFAIFATSTLSAYGQIRARRVH